MGILMHIGDVKISDTDFAAQGFPTLSYGRATKEYPLGNGKYTTRLVNRKAPTMTIALVHAPGQQMSGTLARFTGGGSWWGTLQALIALADAPEERPPEPIEVSMGTVDFGEWFVEQVDVRGDKTTIAGSSGFTSATFDVIIRLKAVKDDRF